MMMSYGYGAYGLPLMMPVMMLFWVLLLFAIVYGATRLTLLQKRKHHRDDEAEMILRERFARGEIEEEEFQKRSELLQSMGRGKER